jgi:GT2 family glycosyltransferase
MLSITVLVPTYRRPDALADCLNALKQQTRLANQVLLVVRDTDVETWQFLSIFDEQPLPLQVVKVTVPGQVSALNAGLDSATSDIIAITDDDAIPHADWLERIEAHFLADERVGGVGGRDFVYHGDRLVDGAEATVGKVSWFGRVTGNHHIGTGLAREVDVLKGANMSYRRIALRKLRFNNKLKGSGAQVHNDLAFSLAVKQQGWKLIYDPAVAVDHHPAQRFDEDGRQHFSSIATSNAAYNETLILLSYLSFPQRLVYLFWALLVGTRDSFGLVQVFRFLPQQKQLAFQKWQATTQGHLQACQDWSTFARSRAQESLT